MRLGEIYETAIKKGIAKDPRSKAAIKKALAAVRKEYNKLTKAEKNGFDKERLRHPYDDTRILNGEEDLEVNKIMVGIDMEVQELLLADRLNRNGMGVDLVMAHHPEGRALAGFYRVMGMQLDIQEKFGMKHDAGEDMLNERIEEVARSIAAVNHGRSVDAAKLLGIPYMCVHTPADNHVYSFLTGLMEKKKPGTIGDVIDILEGIPEYRTAISNSAGPFILAGKRKNKAGRIMVDMTGGTEGSRRVFPRLSQAGVGTIIGMHFSEKHFQSARKEHINMIVAGHISSDTLGLNLFLDELLKKGDIEAVGCSGFKRVQRR